MSDTSPKDDPDLLLEASRIFNAAGKQYRKIAEVVSELATQAVRGDGGKTDAAILCDAAALRLSKRLPGGADKALELLAKVNLNQAEDNGGRPNVLRALANGQKYGEALAAGKDSGTLTALAATIASALEAAFKVSPGSVAQIQHFWEQTELARAAPGSESADGREDDLRLAFERETVVQKVIQTYAPKDPPRQAAAKTSDAKGSAAEPL